jgi:hypothetical protein
VVLVYYPRELPGVRTVRSEVVRALHVSRLVTCTTSFCLSSSLKLIHVIMNVFGFTMTPLQMLCSWVKNAEHLRGLLGE